MEKNALTLKSPRNQNVSIDVMPGHFVTSHSHINFYVDISRVKHEQLMAQEAAAVMAKDYLTTTAVDTIVCMDGSEMIGGFLARELAEPEMLSMNRHKGIYVVPPEFNANGQMIFRDNLQAMVTGKQIVLLIASVTTGKTIKRSLECIQYYGGIVAGITAVFSAAQDVMGIPIHALFTPEDVPGYHTFSFRDCPECKAGKRIDALVNSYGYSEL